MNLHHDEVRKQRSTLAVCPSAKENVCVTDILYEIIEKETYKKDYEKWKKEAKEFMDAIRSEKKTYEEFDKWLEENK